MDEQADRSSRVSPVWVAIAGWLVPGGGYFFIEDYARGITIGVTILCLFIFGLLIGGVRCLDVPGYDAHGGKLILSARSDDRSHEYVGEGVPNGYIEEGWILTHRPVDEIRTKPWSIPQSLVGPLYFICDYWSVRLAAINPDTGRPIGARTHSRINDMGVLYTGVAGMLNLLAIIDAAYRAATQSRHKFFGEIKVPDPARPEAV